MLLETEKEIKERKFYGSVISVIVMVRSNIVGEPLSLSICRLMVCKPLFSGSVRNSM